MTDRNKHWCPIVREGCRDDCRFLIHSKDGEPACDYKTDSEEVERLRQWVHDLQSGMYINCVYCGHRYGPQDEVPATMADVLKAHVEQCPEHPMSKLRAELNVIQHSEFYQRLMKFLKERVESPDGGWAPVSSEDYVELCNIFRAIVEAKWGPDADGDRPINFDVVNRTKYWPLHYQALPYEDGIKTPADMDRYMRLAGINIEVALKQWEQVQRFFLQSWGGSICLRCGGDAANPRSDDPCTCGDPIPTTDNRVIEFIEQLQRERNNAQEHYRKSQSNVDRMTAFLVAEPPGDAGEGAIADDEGTIDAAIRRMGGDPDMYKLPEDDQENKYFREMARLRNVIRWAKITGVAVHFHEEGQVSISQGPDKTVIGQDLDEAIELAKGQFKRERGKT